MWSVHAGRHRTHLTLQLFPAISATDCLTGSVSTLRPILCNHGVKLIVFCEVHRCGGNSRQQFVGTWVVL